jgi:hypothetical protein
MSASQLDVIIEQGSDFVQLWEIQDRDLSSGYTFAAKFRTMHAASSAILTITSFTVAKSGNHTHVSCRVAGATTAALAAPSMGVYDLESTQTSTGYIERQFEGSYFTTPEATR